MRRDLRELRDIEGNDRADDLRGTRGADEIRGRGGDDTLSGGDGADRLRGDEGNDTLFGGNGDDRLRGDKGDDWLTGGAGRDRFIFGTQGGHDVVTDFTDGQDRLDLTNFGFDSAAQALAAAEQDGADTVLTIGGVTITLQGVALSALDAGDLLI